MTSEDALKFVSQCGGLLIEHLECEPGTNLVRTLRMRDPETDEEYEITGNDALVRWKRPHFRAIIEEVIDHWDDLAGAGQAGPNYCSMTGTDPKRPERGPWEITIRPLWGSKSPAELNSKLKARVAELEAQLAEAQARIEHLQRPTKKPKGPRQALSERELNRIRRLADGKPPDACSVLLLQHVDALEGERRGHIAHVRSAREDELYLRNAYKILTEQLWAEVDSNEAAHDRIAELEEIARLLAAALDAQEAWEAHSASFSQIPAEANHAGWYEQDMQLREARNTGRLAAGRKAAP